MRSANSAIECPPEMRAIPYAGPETIVKLGVRFSRIRTEGPCHACAKRSTLLSGIRRAGLNLAAGGTRLYKELRLGMQGVTRRIYQQMEGGYRMKLPKLLAGLAV